MACSRRLNRGDGRKRSERQKRARKGGAGESWKRANVPSFRSPLLWLFPLRSPFGATLHYFESMTHAIFTRKEESNDSDNFSESLLLLWRGNKRPEVNWSTIKVNLFFAPHSFWLSICHAYISKSKLLEITRWRGFHPLSSKLSSSAVLTLWKLPLKAK